MSQRSTAKTRATHSRSVRATKTATATKSPAKSKRRPRAKITRAAADEIFARLSATDPKPESELEYRNPFTLLVAVVLSAQATDAGVNKATRPLFAIADTPEAMLALGEDTVRDYIKTIGLYRNKAKNVIALCEGLIANHNSAVPEDRDALEQLPGVGRKTANVVMNVAFGHPTMAVDTHVFRVANRTGLAPGTTPLEVEEGLLRIIPEAYALHAHHWLILHGRYICKARKPNCLACEIRDLCTFKEKTVAA
ncbi:MAG: endonuclease III [Pseudomonadota bacterium]